MIKTTVTTITTESEFEQFDKILSDFYGTSHNQALTKKWWKEYPHGSVIIKIGSLVIGGITLYPIEADVFEKFKDGLVKEEDLEIDSIKRNNWYILDYIVIKEYRNMKNLVTLSLSTFELWYSLQSGQYPIQVISTPITKSGEKGAKSLKLKLIKSQGADKLPIYFMQINSNVGLRYYIYFMKTWALYIRAKYWLKSLLPKSVKS